MAEGIWIHDTVLVRRNGMIFFSIPGGLQQEVMLDGFAVHRAIVLWNITERYRENGQRWYGLIS